MRVFVFGTGRCGTVAVADAFRFAETLTVSHEAHNWLLEYPDNHVAVNAQLRIQMRLLVEKYPDANYIWLERSIEKVTESYARLDRGEWLHRWWSFYSTVRPPEWLWAARRTVDEFVCQCERAYLMCPLGKRERWDIDTVKTPFKRFWLEHEIEGDLDGALASFDVPKNTSEERGD